MRLQAIAILLLIISPAFAEPTAVIVGQSIAIPGELVMLKTTGSQGGLIYCWDSFPKSTKHFFFPVLLPIGITPDGQVEWEHAAIFSSLNRGKFAILLAVAKDDLPALAVHEIAVGEPLPPPPPPPAPLTGLAKLVYEWALADTPVAKRQEYATALAGSFSLMAAKIAAGTVTRSQDIIDQTTTVNRQAIGAAGKVAWMPWFQRLRVYLNVESKAGRLVTPNHHAGAWSQIAKGLRAVK